MTARINRRQVRIEWGDCDPAGIVYFPRYFELFDACTNAAFEAVGYPKPKLLSDFRIAGIPAVDVRATFTTPCTFGEYVDVDTTIAHWGRSSFKVQHRLLKNDVAAVEGFETRVWTVRDVANPARIHSSEIPSSLKGLFEIT